MNKQVLKWRESLKKMLAKPDKPEVVIYGVTDRLSQPWWVQANDWMIDNSPISTKEKSLFFHSLKLLVGSGLGFIRALEMLSERSRNHRLSRILATAAHDMNNGKSFSVALGKYPRVFAQDEVKMLLAGEVSGRINEGLDSLVEQIQKKIALNSRIRRALMYPLTAFIGVILAIVILLVVVIPRFESMFESLGGELPPMTQFVVSMASAVTSHGIWIVFVLVVSGLSFQSWSRSQSGKKVLHGLWLEIPVFGGIVRNIQTLRISRQLGLLLDSRIPLQKALRILSQILPNVVMSQAIRTVEDRVRAGESLSQSFQSDSIFDPVLSEVTLIGEKSGQTSQVLKRLADQYELEIDSSLKNLTSLVEPFVIVAVGGLIVFMALAIMGPIFQIQELVVQ